jgi:serine protease Do
MTRATDLALLAAAVCGLPLDAQTLAPRTPVALAQFSTSIEELARASNSAVVQITVKGRSPLEDGGVQRTGFIVDQSATGSGVIVDPDGLIVTNAHVIIDARHIDVSVIEPGDPGEPARHKHFPAKAIGLDRETDLAVLKIEARGLPTLSFMDDADTLRQGQLVVALAVPSDSITP